MERMGELAGAAKAAAYGGHSEADFTATVASGLSEGQLRFALEKFRGYRGKFLDSQFKFLNRGLRQPGGEAPHADAGPYPRIGPYVRAGTIPIEFVLRNAGRYAVRTEFEMPISFTSWRIRCYAAKGVRCARCGLEGSFFAVERFRHQDTANFHLNLYHLAGNGGETMITVDHIFPKSKGGGNGIDNLQVLCGPCNFHKADKVEDDGRVA